MPNDYHSVPSDRTDMSKDSSYVRVTMYANHIERSWDFLQKTFQNKN